MMDVAVLRVFIEVVRRGSFAAVARERNVMPSSISRSIAGLERELGVRLFQRTTRRLSPTEAARAYFEHLNPLVDELEKAAAIARDAGKRPRGVLRVTAPPSFAQVNLIPLVPEFCRLYPEVQLELLLVDAVLDLVERGIDVALRLGPLPDSSLVAHRLCDMRYVVCGSPSYLRQHGRPKEPSELGRHQCLRYPISGVPARGRFSNPDGSVVEVPVQGPVTATNGLALVQCAVAGLGLIMLPAWNVARELHQGSLVRVLSGYTATASDFDIAAWALYASREYLPLKIRVFVDFLKQRFHEGAPAEAPLRAAGHRRER